MIKLLVILLSTTFVFGETALFLFPHDHQRFLRYWERSLAHSGGDVAIFSPEFGHSRIKSAPLGHARKGGQSTLTLQNMRGDPLAMVQYRNITLYRAPNRPMRGSTLIIADTLLCTLPVPVSEEEWGSESFLGWCSDEAETLRAAEAALAPLNASRKPYLE